MESRQIPLGRNDFMVEGTSERKVGICDKYQKGIGKFMIHTFTTFHYCILINIINACTNSMVSLSRKID